MIDFKLRRAAERDAALAKARSVHGLALTRADEEKRTATEKATRALREAEAALVAAGVALQLEHVAAVDKALTPLLATFSRDGGSRDFARSLIDTCRKLDELVLAELGAELRLGHWLALGFCRAEIAADPGSALAFGDPSAWACASLGFGNEAHAAAAAVRAGDPFMALEALRQLERAVHLAALKVPRDPRNAGRFDAIARCVVNTNPLEQHDRERLATLDRGITEEWKHNLARVRRYRSGDLSAADGQPPEWAESALLASEELFGRLHAVHGGVRRAGSDDAIDRS